MPIDECCTAEGVAFSALERRGTMQGISEALSWAENRGRVFEQQKHDINMLLKEKKEADEQISDLRKRLLKLAEDFQGVIKENEQIRHDANEQAVALTTEVETLKRQLVEMKAAAREVDPLMRRAVTTQVSQLDPAID